MATALRRERLWSPGEVAPARSVPEKLLFGATCAVVLGVMLLLLGFVLGEKGWAGRLVSDWELTDEGDRVYADVQHAFVSGLPASSGRGGSGWLDLDAEALRQRAESVPGWDALIACGGSLELSMGAGDRPFEIPSDFGGPLLRYQIRCEHEQAAKRYQAAWLVVCDGRIVHRSVDTSRVPRDGWRVIQRGVPVR